MLLSITLTCVVGLGIATLLLMTLGHRVRFSSRVAGLGLGALVILASGELASILWGLPTLFTLQGELAMAAGIATLVWLRPRWNPIGQVFFGTLVTASVSYLAFAGYVTVAAGLSASGVAASAGLLVLELAALTIASSYAFESCDVACRTQDDREFPAPDESHQPMVSLHVPAYNEPPDMLIETIASLEALDYPDFEIVVIDNNTTDESVWKPVEEYCRTRERVKFVHVAPWPGFKSGALNLVLRRYTDPRAEIVGVVDADYLVRPDYLKRTVGHFARAEVAFVQTPQDYREFEGDAYLTGCYDAYKYFFESSMPSRNQRDSIIFGGTMGLIRRSVLQELGGWDEWCITEDAEVSLRMLKAGHSGVYINESFGRGIMPLTFPALKRQRFRWCFGGVQILRKHFRALLPWSRDAENQLSIPQRLDYLFGGLQWFNDLMSLGFTVVLLAAVAFLTILGGVSFRPLLGAAIVLPAALIGSGLLRALWTLRHRLGISRRRAALAFVSWLSLSWTVALACLQGLIRSEGVFLRTPKWKGRQGLLEALRETRIESALAAALWSGAIFLSITPARNPLVIGLLLWQGAVYASAPFMSWLNLHSELSARLERRRRTEELRERITGLGPRLVGTAAASLLLAGAAALFLAGGSEPSPRQEQIFTIPERSADDQGPLGNLGQLVGEETSPPEPAPPASPGEDTSGEGTGSESVEGSPEPSPEPSPDAQPSPEVVPEPEPGTSPEPPSSPPAEQSPGAPSSPGPTPPPENPGSPR